MKRVTILLAAVGLVTGAGVALAQEPLGVHGFVDAGYAGNFDLRDDAFGLNQAEVDLTRQTNGDLALRADLEWVKDGETWAVAAEQGFLNWRPAFCRPVMLTLGKFNAPIGWELLDAPDMNQATHGLLFTYATPTNLTGAMLAGNLGAALDWKAYAVNGWDRNAEDNGVKTWGGRLGYTRAGRAGGGLSVISGLDDTAQDVRRTVVDVDLTLTPSESVLLGAEFNHGRVDSEGTEFAWTGFMLMAHVKANGWLGLTGRFDTLDDADDWLFDTGLPGRHSALTFAPVFTLGAGMRALAELRLDTADEDVFPDRDGSARGSTTSAAFTMTHTF